MAEPFKPFRLFLSDGSHHDVMHPEVAWVWGNRVFIGQNGGKNVDDYAVKQLSILHLTRAEEFPQTRSVKK